MSATISITNTSSDPNLEVPMDIVLNPDGSSISSLQFDLSEPFPISAGGATVAANKQIQTANLPDGKMRVIIFGLNQTLIASGVLAVIRVLAGAVGVKEIKFSSIVASDQNGTAVVVTGIDGTLTVIGGGPMATEQELDAALQTVSDGLTTLASAVTELVAQVSALIAKVQTNPQIDLTDELATAQALAASISANTASLQAAVAAAKQVTEPPTP